jgi:hypothetical protein
VLVEGNLHRPFPGLIREGMTMGVIIGLIEVAPAANPLTQLKGQVKALRNSTISLRSSFTTRRAGFPGRA